MDQPHDSLREQDDYDDVEYENEEMEELARELSTCEMAEMVPSDCDWYETAMRDKLNYTRATSAREGETPSAPITQETGWCDADYEMVLGEEQAPQPEAFFRSNSRDCTGLDSDDDEWVVEEILKKTRKKWVVYYLVKWKGYTDTTWETESDMQEYGWEDWLVRFEERELCKKQEKALPWGAHLARAETWHRTRVISAECSLRRDLLAGAREILQHVELPPREPVIVGKGCSFEPELYWPNFAERVGEAFREHGNVALRIQNICQPSLLKEFNTQFKEMDSGLPVMTFHGTHERNIPGIVRHGLRIPGKLGVMVANGSAHGIGIYMSTTTPTPMSYAQSTVRCVVVCATLVGQRFMSTKRVGDWIIVFDERQVLPCWLVEFAPIPFPHDLVMPYDANSKMYPLHREFYRPERWPPVRMGKIELSAHPEDENLVSLTANITVKTPPASMPKPLMRAKTKGSGKQNINVVQHRAEERGVSQRERKKLANKDRDRYGPRHD